MADLGTIAKSFARVAVARIDWPPPGGVKTFSRTGTAWYAPWVAPQIDATVTRRVSRVILTPLWWGSRPIGTLPMPDYKIEGHVYQRDEEGNDTPSYNCVVHLHVRRSGVLTAITRTNSAGYYRFGDLMPIPDGYYAVALDPDGAPLQNAIVLDRLQVGSA